MTSFDFDLKKTFAIFLGNAVSTLEQGHLEAHKVWLEAAAFLNGTDDDSLFTLVESLASQQSLADALAVAESWSKLRPHNATSHNSRGCLLAMSGRYVDALPCFRRAMECNANFPRLRKNLAAALIQCHGHGDESRALLEDAVKAEPHDSDTWTNLCIARCNGFDLDGALAAGQRAIELNPQSTDALNIYSLALKEAQCWDAAEKYARAVCDLSPGDASLRFNLSILELGRGDFQQGWRDYESRWQGPHASDNRWPVFPKPRWRGESLEGKTLLLWGEQGMGDLLQFCRFAPALAQQVHKAGGRLEWNSFPQMGGLLERSLSKHVDGFSTVGTVEALPEYDYHLPLLSVPLVLDVREETIPATPYLNPDVALVAFWKKRLAVDKRLKV
ncbi:tetratricopeptide repeat protein [Caballeronia insecticola]|uniref:Uncharacterized protein n=1 Tax=Caballeronia insecticola TaxID=758793 RepID=R4X307_9BURK|nr:tetratricopeptide repeat protein [Caballeronia insecticola]BAN27036.1 putative uncharacterized protein [Caballeronia insecticola]